MKWVKCICSEIDGSGYKNITTGKIYEVVNYDDNQVGAIVKLNPHLINAIKLINDIGEERGVFLYDFEDVTAEVITNERDNKINDILGKQDGSI